MEEYQPRDWGRYRIQNVNTTQKSPAEKSGRGELGANQQAAKASATVRTEKYDVAVDMHGERKRIVLTIVVVRPGYYNYR